MKIKSSILQSLTIGAVVATGCTGQQRQPNVIVILADDLGVGDVSAYGSKTISTPNIDHLAYNGVQFTNGYAASATSTPSRYALLTGLYPWKNADAKILAGDAPLLIKTDQFTLPKMMQRQGYATAAIGKWHLGMGDGNVDWNSEITPSANAVGFDYTNLIAATNDRVPTVYVEDGFVVGLEATDSLKVSYTHNFDGEPTALTNPEMLKMDWSDGHNQSISNGIPRIGYQKGGKSAMWVDEDMAEYFVEKVKSFITDKKDKPFFLYYGLHQPHVPRVPNSKFVGSTTLGPRGDAIVEADWCIGELMAHLKREGLLENTIVIFSSDNGPVLDDGYKDFAQEMLGNHDQLGGLRGGKYSLFEGGTKVPLIVYWKGKIEPVKSSALISQIDIMPSIANLIGADFPQIDGQNHLDALLGLTFKGRTSLIHEAQGKLSYRTEDWALIPPYSGAERNNTGNELGNFPSPTLWCMKTDHQQQTDVSAQHQQVVDSLTAQFKSETLGYYK